MTGIEWTDQTWNPLVGCEWISEGCTNCYAATMAHTRLSGVEVYVGLTEPGDPSPRFTGEIRIREGLLRQPYRWRRPRMVFVNSMSDLFHPAVPLDFLAAVWVTMAENPHHVFQVLTKRPQRMAGIVGSDEFRALVEDVARDSLLASWPLPNVWLGTSIETNRYVWRADHLRKTPAVRRFISAEPLLDDLVDLDLSGIDWLIIGGESGPHARPMHPQWARNLRDRALTRTEPCENPDVPLPHSTPVYEAGSIVGGRMCSCAYPDPVRLLVKQWGEWRPTMSNGALWTLEADGRLHRRDGEDAGAIRARGAVLLERPGKSRAGRTLDGIVWNEFPT